MRQAGVLAAAGIVALRENVERLSEDHANARRLAEAVAGLKGLAIDMRIVQTNIVLFSVDLPGMRSDDLVQRWREEGVLALAIDDRQVRVVTHYEVDAAGIDRACASLSRILRDARSAS